MCQRDTILLPLGLSPRELLQNSVTHLDFKSFFLPRILEFLRGLTNRCIDTAQQLTSRLPTGKRGFLPTRALNPFKCSRVGERNMSNMGACIG